MMAFLEETQEQRGFGNAGKDRHKRTGWEHAAFQPQSGL